MKKSTKIEITFWLIVFFVFSPRITLEIYEYKLKKSLTQFENSEWIVKDKEGKIIYDKLKLPFQLRWLEEKTKRREWVFEKKINIAKFKNDTDLGIVLGRVGDSDYVTFNDCLIGSTSLDMRNLKPAGWGWSLLRKYYVPPECIEEISTIKYHVYKFEGPSYGVYGGPIGFGSFEKISKYIRIMNVLQYEFQFAFGIGLIFFISTQYLFVWLLETKKAHYRIFSLLSVNIGVFLIMISVYPFQIFSNHLVLMWILFGSALGSAILFLVFFKKTFFVNGNFLFKIFCGISSILFLFSILSDDFDGAYKFYELWYPVFIITFTIYFIPIIQSYKKNKNIYLSKYIFAYLAFLICCLHDVIVTVLGISNAPILGSSFSYFVIVVALTLSQEYSDAFSNIEDQVVQRTDDLNGALVKIKQVQFLKDDQAKRFAHDIRSPLAALQVLKEIVSQQLQDDAKDLLKHTIVRINDLANTALPRLIDAETPTSQETDVFLWPVLDKLVSEKRLEYTYLSELKIELKNLTPIFELHARCDEIELTRMVSNLINNSIEARKLDQSLLIYIYIERNNFQIEISIEDFGKGIPEQYLNDVFKAGFSYGKKGGMGVGLSHAKNILETWGGKINIDSKVNIGTNIKLQIPISNSPDWLLTKLNLNVENLVIVDDHAFVVDTWRQKLVGIMNPPNIYWVQNRLNWDQSEIHKLNWKNTLFLVDQDLGSGTNGLDLIKEFNLYCNTVLVTGNNDDLELRKKAVKLGIKILPKALIHIIPVVTPS